MAKPAFSFHLLLPACWDCMFNLLWILVRFVSHVSCWFIFVWVRYPLVEGMHFLIQSCFWFLFFSGYGDGKSHSIICVFLTLGTWSPCGQAGPSWHPHCRSGFLRSLRFNHVNWQAWWDIDLAYLTWFW